MKNLFLKIISFAVVISMIASMGIMVRAYEYPDEGYWANEAIDAAIANGLLRGKEDGKIHSEDNLTRAEMAAIMVRSFGATVKADVSDYVDLEPSAWYYDEFSKAVQMRVFEGDGSGHMRPNDPITREEVFTVVARAMVLSDSDHSVLSKFKDSSEISSWALDYMSIMAKKSYVNGDETGNVNPKDYITRAEFAQLMYNIYKTYYLTTGSYSDTVDTACVMINTESVNLTNVVVEGDLIIGDGANESTIKLTDVTIEGRLLVRGSARIELVDTTIGEMVVVNNFNNTVHFDNYRDEKVFDGIIENTKATFKQRTGGGGGGGGSSAASKAAYTVKYYHQDAENLLVYNEVETVNDSAKVNTTVNAEIKDYTGFELNEAKSIISGTVVKGGGLVLEVYYDRKDMVVSFDAGEGVENPADITVKYGTAIGTLPVVSKDDYGFMGWYIKGTDTEVTETTVVEEGMELEAKWSQTHAKYTIIYKLQNTTLDGYDEVTADKVTDTAEIGSTVTATVKTYTGFMLKDGSVTTGIVLADGSLEIVLEYDRIDLTVSFDAGEGVENPADITVKYGTAIGTLPAVSKDDYGFMGWYIKGTDTEVTETTVVKEGMELEAKWSQTYAKYTVRYYKQNTALNGYDEVTEDRVTDTARIGSTVTATVETYTGFTLTDGSVTTGTVLANGSLEIILYYDRNVNTYNIAYYHQNENLAGYTVEETVIKDSRYGVTVSLEDADIKEYTGFDRNINKGVTSAEVSGDNTTTLSVYYDRESYTITFDAGEGVEDPANVTAYYGVEVTLPTLAKTDYTFKGWSDGTNTLNGNVTFTADTDLTAVWEYTPGVVAYTVEYYTQNTDLTTYEMTSEQKNGTVGTEVTVTPEDKTGFDVNTALSVLSGTVSRENPLVLKVYYDRESYTITFDAGEGVEDPANVTAYYGVEVTLPTLTKTDYTFKGWSDGTNTLNGNVTFTAKTDLTAVWEYTPGMVAYTVEYYTQNTDLTTYEITSEQKSGTAGAEVTVTPEDKTGFDVNTALSVLEGTVSRENPLVLKVYYDRESYTITFDAGEGVEDPANVTAYYGVEVTLPTVSKDEYEFKGWSDGTNTLNGNVTFTAKTDLTAVWEKIADVVTVTFYDMGYEVASVDVERNTTMEETQFPDYGFDYKGYVKDSNVSSVYAEPYTHVISYGWWYNPEAEKWEEFTTETVVANDLDVHLKTNKFSAIVTLADGMSFNFYTYYETDTRFADTIKDILYIDETGKGGAPLKALKTSGYWDKIRANGKVQKVLDEDDNIMMLSYMVKFSQILGEENVEKFIVDGAKESFGNNTQLEKAFVEYLKAAVDSSDAEYVKEVKGLMVRAFEHVIDDDPTLVDELEALAHSIMEDPAAFEEITGYDYEAFTEEQRDVIIDEVVVKLETPSTERDETVSTLIDYLFTENHKHELEDLVHYAMVFLNDHPDERDQVVDNIIEELYRADLDKLVYQLINNDRFEINERITFVAEGMKNTLLRDYNYETFVGSKIPERLEKAFEIYPEEKIIELYDYAMNDIIAQIDDAIAIAEAGGTAKIDSGITPVVNVIGDLYVPLYEGMMKLIEDKATDKYYYSENIYLQELVKLLDPEIWVTGSANAKPSDTSGYKIYDLDYYYDLMYKIIVLGDDAILWYYENLSEEEYVELTNNYQSLVLKYVNIIVDNVNAYVTDGTLPHEKLTVVEKAIMERYPELVNKIIDKYTNSEYFGKEATADDYQKIRDKMYELFHNVNLTTNEYFDKVLNHEAMEDLEDKFEENLEDKLDGKIDGEYYTKIDDNTYEFEANDYKVRFERELTDA